MCSCVCVFVYLCMCIRAYLSVCMCVRLCVYVGMFVYVYVSTINWENFMHENIHMLNVCVNKFSCRLHNIINAIFFQVEITEHVLLIKRLVAMYTSLFCYRDS